MSCLLSLLSFGTRALVTPSPEGAIRLREKTLLGGVCAPVVVSAIGHNMVNFGPPNTVPEKFKDRKFYQHNPTVTLMRTTVEEILSHGELCTMGFERRMARSNWLNSTTTSMTRHLPRRLLKSCCF